MSIIQKLRRHLRQGTLGEVVSRRLGILPEYIRVRWEGADNPAQGARVLAKRARIFVAQASPAAWVLSLGAGEDFHKLLDQRLRHERVAFKSQRLEDLGDWSSVRTEGLVAVLCGYSDSRRMTQAARWLAAHPVLGRVPFEYVNGLDRERGVFARLDEYSGTFFVSPVLLDQPSPYELYEESLKHFEQKCGLRDFLDLYQLLKAVVSGGVPGDIAEFGSYRGHSGYLIGRTLQALGSDKRLCMFDTFEGFPPEPLGVDHFWNRSHNVDFADVRRKFSGLPNVTLVKGDFTQTLSRSGLGGVALAYVDCDSYRATRFLFDALLPRQLSVRGVLVCEDYGHPALLGNRAAVHESLETVRGSFQYFSQFSGLYVLVKH